MPPAANADVEDPVLAEYDVFITPEIEQQQLYMLQYLNRSPDHPLTRANTSEPSQLRIKKDSGFIEVDVPINIHQNYNRLAGVRWGESLRKTKSFGQRAFGIASGFERTMPRVDRSGPDGGPAPQAPIDDDDNQEDYVHNFDDANEKGHVLNAQTFGGQLMKDDGKGPSYMLGTFRDDQLHLTRLDGLVQLRTQFHHIDASAQLDAVNRRREKESQEGAKPAEPKAFLPTIKKIGGDTSAELTQAFMKSAHHEPWETLNYHDEETEVAYSTYADRLFMADVSEAPKLHSKIGNDHFLDVISAPSSGKGSRKRATTKRTAEDSFDISDESDDDAEHVDDQERQSSES